MRTRADLPQSWTCLRAFEPLKAPWSQPPPSWQAPAAPGPQPARAHAEPRPGAVPNHSRCPDGSRVWAGGGQAVGRAHHAHPSSCAASPEPALAPPAQPGHSCLGHLHGVDVPASGAGGVQGLFPVPPTPALSCSWAPLTLRVGEASSPLATLDRLRRELGRVGPGWRRRRRLFPFVRLHRGWQ